MASHHVLAVKSPSAPHQQNCGSWQLLSCAAPHLLMAARRVEAYAILLGPVAMMMILAARFMALAQ
jgi:hypothetical protein